MSVLGLLQVKDDSPLSLLIQAAIVVIFFVLPALRAVLEKSKRSAGKPRLPSRPGVPKPSEGRDLWRELLSGKPSEPPLSPPRTTASPPRPAPTPRVSTVPRPSPARPRPVELSPSELERLRPPAAAERAPVVQIDRPKLETLRPQLDTQSVAELAKAAPSPVQEADPATLDEEMGLRWGESGETPGARTRAMMLGRGADWRRAVLLSEVLAPPLALRGPSSAWPGPPWALGR